MPSFIIVPPSVLRPRRTPPLSPYGSHVLSARDEARLACQRRTLRTTLGHASTLVKAAERSLSGREEARMTQDSIPADESRRDFLRTSVVLGGLGASMGALTSVQLAHAQGMPPGVVPGTRNHYYIPAAGKTV